MIEKLNTDVAKYESQPAAAVLELLRKLKSSAQGNVTVAEVGVGYGATTLEMLKLLECGDALYLFDYGDNVAELIADIRNSSLDRGVRIVGVGNQRKTYDSYAWNLGKLLRRLREENAEPRLFDLVYLDGAHTFLHDMAAICVLKQLLGKGGYLILDDLLWTFRKSPTNNPAKNPGLLKIFTEEQLATPHIQFIVDLVLRYDDNFRPVIMEAADGRAQAYFQRIT